MVCVMREKDRVQRKVGTEKQERIFLLLLCFKSLSLISHLSSPFIRTKLSLIILKTRLSSHLTKTHFSKISLFLYLSTLSSFPLFRLSSTPDCPPWSSVLRSMETPPSFLCNVSLSCFCFCRFDFQIHVLVSPIGASTDAFQKSPPLDPDRQPK